MGFSNKPSRRVPLRRSDLDISTLYRPSEYLKNAVRYPYQDEAVHQMTSALANQAFSILVLPTGSGRTFVANEIAHGVAESGGTVLWLALNWELLVQASSAYSQRFGGVQEMARVGGGRSPLSSVLQEAPQRPIQYTTLHTWYGRRKLEQLAPNQVDLIVIDECHWSIGGMMGRALLSLYLGRVPTMGLSATPRRVQVPSGTAPARVGYGKTFSDLEGTVLATPRLETPFTNTNWRPYRLTTGDFSPASLRELAADEDRNELICRTLLGGIRDSKYSRVMVFACSEEHANNLARLLSIQGIEARSLHNEIGSDAQKAKLVADFQAGIFNVIVNVAMLTHGIDVPEVDAVFLTRPTASEVMCSQMVGRGARRIEGLKHSFWIVEFTDNLEQHSDALFHARHLLPVTVVGRLIRKLRRVPDRHIPPPPEPRFVQLTAPFDVAGLMYVEDQTFGVEIEFTSPLGSPDSTGFVYSNGKWDLVARLLIRAIESVASFPVDPNPRNYHEVDETDQWRVEFDRSAGWEVVSPVLRNQEGFDELVNVLSSLNALLMESDDLHIDHTAGLHLTLGSEFTDDEQVQGFVKLIQRLEPGLFSLVKPSRLYSFQDGHYSLRRNNKYCRPLRDPDVCVDDLKLSNFRGRNPSVRYRTVNLSPVEREDQQIEIRLHHGTTEYPEVVAWISLWMTIFNRARFHWPLEGSNSRIFPGGNTSITPDQARSEDLFALLDDVEVHLDPRLREDLTRRRIQLFQSWKKAIPQRVKSWRRGWRR